MKYSSLPLLTVLMVGCSGANFEFPQQNPNDADPAETSDSPAETSDGSTDTSTDTAPQADSGTDTQQPDTQTPDTGLLDTSDPDAKDTGTVDTEPPPACMAGEVRCNGLVPEKCNTTGSAWDAVADPCGLSCNATSGTLTCACTAPTRFSSVTIPNPSGPSTAIAAIHDAKLGINWTAKPALSPMTKPASNAAAMCTSWVGSGWQPATKAQIDSLLPYHYDTMSGLPNTCGWALGSTFEYPALTPGPADCINSVSTDSFGKWWQLNLATGKWEANPGSGLYCWTYCVKP
jgi:hypothetical protein